MHAANKVHKSAVAVIPSHRFTETVQKLRCFRDKSFLVGTGQQHAGSQQQHSSSSSSMAGSVQIIPSMSAILYWRGRPFRHHIIDIIAEQHTVRLR
jgi:hypothetical protein